MGNQQGHHHHQRLNVPYETPINPPISYGTQIHISGTPAHGANRFEVNLANHRGDIVLHINPRFDQNAVVLTSAPGGNWGAEERQSLTLHRGQQFSLIIMVTAEGFKLALNNHHFADFRHRIPFNAAELVQVKGDIQLNSVQIYPGYGGGHGSQGFSMHVPFMQNINMFPGRTIQIEGRPTGQRMEINLLSGPHDGADVVLHFNPRFDQREIVRNSCQHGGWGAEEKHGHFPLQSGVPFHVQIVCYPQHYQILVNGQPFTDFHHRVPFQLVQALQIKGDVQLTNVRVM